MPKYELLAALLAYRAIYYLAPLTLAAVLYLVAETRAKKSAYRTTAGQRGSGQEIRIRRQPRCCR